MKRILIILGIIAIIIASLVAISSGKHKSYSHSTNNTKASYKDGVYNGSIANAYYGNVQVQVDIQNKKIKNVKFLQYPNLDPTSVDIAKQIMPYLTKEAIKAQSSHVNIISGATYTSEAFIQSLIVALQKA